MQEHKYGFNVRVYSSRRSDELKAEMLRVGVEWAGILKMSPKAAHYVVKVHNLRTPAILILKEEMLAKGGDCAIHHAAILHRLELSDCILMGTEKVFRQVIDALQSQPFELPAVAAEIKAALDCYGRRVIHGPASEDLPQNLRSFYSAILDRTMVMGILNVTPDSFSDGGSYGSTDAAVDRAVSMVEDGADVIDIGGESSRPNADPVSDEEELNRVIPVIESLADRVKVPISIDTYKPQVARAALDAGASIINDITGFISPEMCLLAAERKCPAILMHMKGMPQTMQINPMYNDLMDEVSAYFRERIAAVVEAGLPEEYIILDPGIGFSKTAEHNLEILRKMADFKSLGLPILIGTSRKAFIGKTLDGVSAQERAFGTAATVAIGIANGANIIRVHDVKEMSQVARVSDAILRQGEGIEFEHLERG